MGSKGFARTTFPTPLTAVAANFRYYYYYCEYCYYFPRTLGRNVTCTHRDENLPLSHPSEHCCSFSASDLEAVMSQGDATKMFRLHQTRDFDAGWGELWGQAQKGEINGKITVSRLLR